jgi:hypothetical protein
MTTLFLLIIFLLAYWLDRPDICFWIVIFALVNGILGLVKAIFNRNWYINEALRAGVEPSLVMLFGTKIVVSAFLLWVAWLTGTAAKYF